MQKGEKISPIEKQRQPVTTSPTKNVIREPAKKPLIIEPKSVTQQSSHMTGLSNATHLLHM